MIRGAVFFPHSPVEKTNSGVARLELFQSMPDLKYDLYHFGQGTSDTISIGPYYPEGNPKNFGNLLKLLKEFGRRHKQQPYQVIWVTLPPLMMALFASIVARLYRIPLIIDVRDPAIASVVINFSPSSFRYRLAHALEKWTYRGASRIGVVTPELKDLLVAEFGCDPPKIEWIPNGTTMKETHKTPMAKPVRVFFAGAFAPYQVMDQVVTSLLRDAPDKPNFVFDFYGLKPGTQPEIPQMIKDHKAEKWLRIHAPEARETVFQVLKDAHLVIVPIADLGHPELYDYAIPLKFYEALAYSKPILLFCGTKASKRALTEHNVGLICAPKDNIWLTLQQLADHYDDYQAAAAKTIYLRQDAAAKVFSLMTELMKKP